MLQLLSITPQIHAQKNHNFTTMWQLHSPLEPLPLMWWLTVTPLYQMRESLVRTLHTLSEQTIYIAIACSVILVRAHISTITATCIRAYSTPLHKLQWLLHCAVLVLVGGGGGSLMLLLYPWLTCTDAGHDLCTLCPNLYTLCPDLCTLSLWCVYIYISDSTVVGLWWLFVYRNTMETATSVLQSGNWGDRTVEAKVHAYRRHAMIPVVSRKNTPVRGKQQWHFPHFVFFLFFKFLS